MKQFTAPSLPPYLLAAALAAILVALPAELSAGLIKDFGDWSAFQEKEGGRKVCYAGSTPKQQRGKYKKRGETFVLVTHRPAEKSRSVVSFKAGYIHKKGSEVLVAIGTNKFKLFTDKDHAWAFDTRADQSLVAAMRAGSQMAVTGTSSRGTKTTDMYSLRGFTAAYNAISKACPAK